MDTDIKQISIVVEPRDDIILQPSGISISTRQFYECDRLVEELQPHIQTKLRIVEDSLEALASFEGYLLWFRPNNRDSVLRRNESQFILPKTFWHRVILMADMSEAEYNFLNVYSLAGAIDFTTYSRWQNGIKPLFLYGLRSVIQEITGLVPGGFGRYAKMSTTSELFDMLGRYLKAYSTMNRLMSGQLHPTESDPKWPLIWSIISKEGETQDLHGLDLSQSTLCGLNLKQVNLSEANLSHSRWDFAQLIQANLQGANLTKADFIEANMAKSNLKGAILTKTNLSKSILLSVNLEDTDLSTTILTGALYDRYTRWPKNFDAKKAGAKIWVPSSKF